MLYIKTNNTFETIEDFLKEFFTLDYYPYRDGDYLYGATTFTDEDCKIVDCYTHRWRSVDDIVELVKTYLPNSKSEDIIKALFDSVIECRGRLFYLRIANCRDIEKPTVCFQCSTNKLSSHASAHLSYTNLHRTEYGNWKTLCALVGIYNDEDFENYHLNKRK